MPVAKSYKDMKIVEGPFKENGRLYVNVQAIKGIKKVRWYSDAEYKRMYPDAAIQHDIMDFNARHAFGFDDAGYIYIYRGCNVDNWAAIDRTNIWFNNTFGYYTPSKFKLPSTPAYIKAIKIPWDLVKEKDNKMKPHNEVQKIVDNIVKSYITNK